MADRLLLRPREAAEQLGISRSLLYVLLAAGEIETIRVGRLQLIPHQALEAWIARKQREK